jgi:hypothetical protein
MRTAIRIGIVLAVLLGVYTVWPFYDLYRLASSIQARDLAALEKEVDFRAVRGSVSRQVLTTYLALTGKGNLGSMGRELAVGAAVSLSTPALDEYATPARLLELFGEGLPELQTEPGPRGSRGIRLVAGDLATAWRLYMDSEYRFGQFTVRVPPQFEPERRYGLQLRLIRWRWKLTAVELPGPVRTKIAQAMIKASERK